MIKSYHAIATKFYPASAIASAGKLTKAQSVAQSLMQRTLLPLVLS